MNSKNEMISEQELNEKICEAWNNLDAEMIAPYLDDDLTYDALYFDEPMVGKSAFLEHLTRKFKALSDSAVGIHAGMEDENGVMKPVLRCNTRVDVYDMTVENGLITELLIRPPYSRFKFENLNEDYPALLEIATDALQGYFSQNVEKPWGWLQNQPSQIRFQDLCIAYDHYVLCICVGMIRKTLEYGRQVFVNQQQFTDLIKESENYHMTPCLFLIDSAGNPYFDGTHLIDARTYKPIVLNHLEDDNGGKMSDWEVHNLGVNTVRHFLEKEGYTDVDYCDIIEISPQIFFKDGNCQCYAFVRSVPNGLANQKYIIEANKLERLKQAGLKGYFVDVRWSWLRGGTGCGDESFLIRGTQLNSPESGVGSNLMCNKLELIEIDKAIQELPFIEVVD